MKYSAFIITAATCLTFDVTHAEDLQCLTEAEHQQASLYQQLQQRAYAALDRRDSRFLTLKTGNQISEYQDSLKSFFVEQLGGFPERTPLNARTVKTIQADGYRIENVIFESQPNHHITANLYLPNSATTDTAQRVPAIAVSSGHSRTAKTADYNQRFGIMLAKHGMAALCFDPIGQGERSQILTSDGQPKFSGTTTEHFLVGVGSILVGRNTARYRVWDAMRAIDYLCSRPEIDADRIGFTGCSGGGTLTSYVMALDDRITCAAPACYLTTFRRLIETIGPQDAEQNIFGQIAFGMDQPDYVLMRAPRPTLISSTTEDFFDSRGSWENFRQAKQIYGRLGFPERVDLVEAEGKHGVQPQNLATIAHWMQRWLLNIDEPISAEELETRPAEELLCTKTGQVLTSLPGERSVFDLNTDCAMELATQRRSALIDVAEDQQRKSVRNVLKLRPVEEVQPPEWEDRGRVQREGYHIDKLVLKTADGHSIEFGLNEELFERRPRLIGYALTALLLLTLLAWLYVRRLLKPLDAIGEGARRFGAGDFSQPISERKRNGSDELGELAQTINTMGRDIQQMLDAKRALLLAISHELRSPLTRARLNTELLPETADVNPQRDALLNGGHAGGEQPAFGSRVTSDGVAHQRVRRRAVAVAVQFDVAAQAIHERRRLGLRQAPCGQQAREHRRDHVLAAMQEAAHYFIGPAVQRRGQRRRDERLHGRRRAGTLQGLAGRRLL